MTIDASIPLSIRPPQFDNPLDSAGKLLAMKQLMLQNQSGQMNFDDAQRLRALYPQAGGNPEKLRDLLFQGGFPDKAIALDKDILANKKSSGDIAKTQGEVAKQQHEEAVQIAQGVLAAPPDQQPAVYKAGIAQAIALGHEGAKKMPQEWSPQLIPILQHLVSGALTPQQAAERGDYTAAAQPQGPLVQPAATPAPGGLVQPTQAMPTTPQDVTDTTSGAIVRPQNLQQPEAVPLAEGQGGNTAAGGPTSAVLPPQEVTAKAPANTPEGLRAQAAVARSKGTKAGFDVAKDLETSANQLEERILQEQGLSQTAAHQKVVEAHMKVEEANQAEQRKQGWMTIDPFGTLRSAATNFNAGGKSTAPGQPDATQAQGAEFLTSIPKPLGDQVKALAEGRMAFPAGMALKSPYWQNMLQMVSQYDPSFDAVNFNARAAMRKDATSGTMAKSATAINTAIGHLDTLSKAADALNNTNFQAYNSLTNWMASNTGDPRVKVFENTRKAVVDELTRVWRGTGGSEGDIKSWEATLGAASSPAQLHAVIQNIGDLMESRLHALEDQYNKGMGTTESGLQLVEPKNRALLDRLEKKAGGSSPSTLPPTNAKGWTLHVDAKGNKAYVGPNNEVEEVK